MDKNKTTSDLNRKSIASVSSVNAKKSLYEVSIDPLNLSNVGS